MKKFNPDGQEPIYYGAANRGMLPELVITPNEYNPSEVLENQDDYHDLLCQMPNEQLDNYHKSLTAYAPNTNTLRAMAFNEKRRRDPFQNTMQDFMLGTAITSAMLPFPGGELMKGLDKIGNAGYNAISKTCNRLPIGKAYNAVNAAWKNKTGLDMLNTAFSADAFCNSAYAAYNGDAMESAVDGGLGLIGTGAYKNMYNSTKGAIARAAAISTHQPNNLSALQQYPQRRYSALQPLPEELLGDLSSTISEAETYWQQMIGSNPFHRNLNKNSTAFLKSWYKKRSSDVITEQAKQRATQVLEDVPIHAKLLQEDEDALGFYNSNDNSVNITPLTFEQSKASPLSTAIHEKNHYLQYNYDPNAPITDDVFDRRINNPFMYKEQLPLEDVLNDDVYFYYALQNNFSHPQYILSPLEFPSHLMELRYLLRLDPTKKYTYQEILNRFNQIRNINEQTRVRFKEILKNKNYNFKDLTEEEKQMYRYLKTFDNLEHVRILLQLFKPEFLERMLNTLAVNNNNENQLYV